MPVDTPHPSYVAMLPQWRRCRDAAAGSDAVKAAGDIYLPRLDSHKIGVPGITSSAATQKYEEYKLRALFFNATGRTVQGLTGAICQKAPKIEVPDIAKEHMKDVTLTGVSAEDFGRDMVQARYLRSASCPTFRLRSSCS